MKQRFIVMVDSLTREQELDLRARFGNAGVGWWHWVRGTWLLVDRENKLDLAKIYHVLREIAGDRDCLAMRVTEETAWIGYGPAGGQGHVQVAPRDVGRRRNGRSGIMNDMRRHRRSQRRTPTAGAGVPRQVVALIVWFSLASRLLP